MVDKFEVGKFYKCVQVTAAVYAMTNAEAKSQSSPESFMIGEYPNGDVTVLNEETDLDCWEEITEEEWKKYSGGY
jgi:hypothetical protein